MKRFLKWTAALIGIAIGGTYAFEAIQAGRRRLKSALGEAEAVAGKTRATLEATESALEKARTAI